MLRVGLTGGIGAGKSTVARRLAELGAVVVDADRLAREVVEPGTDGLAEVRQAFGPEVITADGTLDRAAMAAVVFADPTARERLEAIVHPRIAALTAERFAAAELAAGPAVIGVHDMPLIVEKRMGGGYHVVIVVHAGVEERVRRLVAERGMSGDDARARIRAQADDADRRAAADVWLDNTGARQALTDDVDRVWSERLLPFAANLAARRPAAGLAPAPDAVARRRVVERLRWALERSDPERAGFVEVAPGRYLSCDPALAGATWSSGMSEAPPTV